MTELNIPIRRLGEEAPYQSHSTVPLRSIYGEDLGIVSQSLPIHIAEDTQEAKIIAALEKIREIGLPKMLEMLSTAADIFLNADLEIGIGIGALSPSRYCELQSSVTGAPIIACEANMKKIHRAMANAGTILENHLNQWKPDLNINELFNGASGTG